MFGQNIWEIWALKYEMLESHSRENIWECQFDIFTDDARSSGQELLSLSRFWLLLKLLFTHYMCKSTQKERSQEIFLGNVSVTNMISKKSDFNGSNTDSPSLEIDEEEYHQTQSTNTICS